MPPKRKLPETAPTGQKTLDAFLQAMRDRKVREKHEKEQAERKATAEIDDIEEVSSSPPRRSSPRRVVRKEEREKAATAAFASSSSPRPQRPARNAEKEEPEARRSSPRKARDEKANEKAQNTRSSPSPPPQSSPRRQKPNPSSALKPSNSELDTLDLTHLTNSSSTKQSSNRSSTTQHSSVSSTASTATASSSSASSSNRYSLRTSVHAPTSIYNLDSEPRYKPNYLFYSNQIESKPNGARISHIHTAWYNDFHKLEMHHGYIQWLFPLFKSAGMNSCSRPLDKGEAKLIRQSRVLAERVIESYRMMLNFYGFQLDCRIAGRVIPHPNDAHRQERFVNLRSNSHNYLRISRILQSLGHLGFRKWKLLFCRVLYDEVVNQQRLPECRDALFHHWIPTLDDSSAEYERETLETAEDREDSVYFQEIEAEIAENQRNAREEVIVDLSSAKNAAASSSSSSVVAAGTAAKKKRSADEEEKHRKKQKADEEPEASQHSLTSNGHDTEVD